MMHLALWFFVLVNHVVGFNPSAVLPSQGIPKVRPQSRPKVVAQTAPDGVVLPQTNPYTLPAPGFGPMGRSFLPPTPSSDPALTATMPEAGALQTPEQEVEETASMQAGGGSWYTLGAGIFGAVLGALSVLGARFWRLSSAAPHRQSLLEMAPPGGAEVVYSASPELGGALQGPIVARFSSPAASQPAPKAAAKPAAKAASEGEPRFAYKTKITKPFFGGGPTYDMEPPAWAKDGGIFNPSAYFTKERNNGIFTPGDVIWAREAEVKHGRVAMLAATGLIVQDIFTFPFFNKWYTGEKVWALHDKLVEVGAGKQVLALIIFFEYLYLQKAAAGELDGTGDLGFDPLGMKSDRRAVTEIKNGRLAMIAFGGMMQHYLITGKGPLQFLAGIPNYKSCLATSSELPGAKFAAMTGNMAFRELADSMCQ